MFNKELYKEVEESSGLRKKFIADSLGIGYSRYITISLGRAEWKSSEIEKASALFRMKRALRDRIFFAQERPKMETLNTEKEVS